MVREAGRVPAGQGADTSGRLVRVVPKKAIIRQRIFDALCAHPYGLSVGELTDIVYASDVNGGPDDALNTMRTHINLLRWYLERTCPMLQVWSTRRSGQVYILVLTKMSRRIKDHAIERSDAQVQAWKAAQREQKRADRDKSGTGKSYRRKRAPRRREAWRPLPREIPAQ
ncbi:MAG TPA: hypothetical protein VF748_14675 [Candidatus Acidoferrum sp.]